MSNTVKWGLIGAAGIARNKFVPAARRSKNAEVIAVSASSAERAQAFSKDLGIPNYYGSYSEMLADADIDAVYIGLLNHHHKEWAIKAAEAGKHVLCEKPLALNAQEATDMADACRDNDVLLMEAFMYRFNPRTIKLRETIDSGKIGKLRSVYADFCFKVGEDSTRLVGGEAAGALMDVGCYCINICRYIMGETPVAVSAHFNNHPKHGCDMTSTALLEFSGGRVAMLQSSMETAGRNNLEIVGDEGLIRVNGFALPPDDKPTTFDLISGGEATQIESPACMQFELEVTHFSDCVLTGKPVMLDPYEEAVPNMLVIDAIRRSARLHERVEVQRP